MGEKWGRCSGDIGLTFRRSKSPPSRRSSGCCAPAACCLRRGWAAQGQRENGARWWPGAKGGGRGERASARPKQGWGRPAGRVSSCGSRGRNRESTFGTRAPPKPFLSAWNSFCCAGILYGSEVGPGEVHLCRRAPNVCLRKGHQLSRWNACTRGPCTERVSRRARRTCWGGQQTCPRRSWLGLCRWGSPTASDWGG